MANPVAVFHTTLGTFKAELLVEQMPITAGNFQKLIEDGFYDKLHFHRVIANFMIQFGCPHSTDPADPRCGMGGPPHGCITDEHLQEHQFSNEPGTLSMANTGSPNSGGSQIFINTAHNSYLDWFSPGASKHPVFGKIIDGMDIIAKISDTPTDPRDRPIEPICVDSITMES